MKTEVKLTLDDAAREVRELREAGFTELANEIEAQLPEPKPKEPTEFGSVIRARLSDQQPVTRWVATGLTWYSEDGFYLAGDITPFRDVEVVRVGVGPSLEQVEDLVQWYGEAARDHGRRHMAELFRQFADRLLGGGSDD